MPKIHYIALLVVAILLSINQYSNAQTSCQATPDIRRITSDVYYLASDELEGRLAGSPGCDLAAEYIASSFENCGLQPIENLNNDYFQNFDITSDVSLGVDNSLKITTQEGEFNYTVGGDFHPLYFSPDGQVQGEVVFAGYGITADEYGWDDYADIDATGKIVLCMRDEPGKDNPDSTFDGINPTLYSGLRWKATNAQNHGAIGLIVVTGPAYLTEGEADEFVGLDQHSGLGEAGIPVIQVNQAVADKLIGTMGAPLSMYQTEMENYGMAFGALIEGVSVDFSVSLSREYASTKNVIGVLPGSDPELSDQYLIIGAHYDHIGWGTIGSLYDGEPAIHNGADDNASGTAGVLELARMFASSETRPRRSILFIAFSAEEMGGLGSIAYINNPVVPLENTVAMINMDMIGRARPGEDGIPQCAIHSTGSALEWAETIPDFSSDAKVEFLSQTDPIGGGDYIYFYLASIPDLNFFTGIHDDYHRPTDDADKINFEGMVSIIDGVYQIACNVAD
ncbi:MAG: M20/M25/M40 family metallo-hydrolase, partial [bacterium]|nr:M20/M25/M40 family metallo-hydrolase [bacterium]